MELVLWGGTDQLAESLMQIFVFCQFDAIYKIPCWCKILEEKKKKILIL